jgi:hypothetical protein
MTRYVIENETTGCDEIVTRDVPMPLYNLGQTVVYMDKGQTKKEGTVSGIVINVESIKDQVETMVQIYYQIDDGSDEVFEDEIIEYYPEVG